MLNTKIYNYNYITSKGKNEKTWKNTEDYKLVKKYINEEDISYLTSYDSWSGKIKCKDLPDGCTISKSLSSEKK